MIDVITANVGGRDVVRQPRVEVPGVSYTCWSTTPVNGAWRHYPIESNGIPPRRVVRPFKILSLQHTVSEIVIWMDACAEPVDPTGFALCLDGYDVIAILHERIDHRTEQDHCRRHRVGDQKVIADQIERYEADGFPGLPFVSGGLIGRRRNERVLQFEELWWREYRLGQERDQFALAYSLWKAQKDFGLRVRVIEGMNIWENPWFKWNHHARRVSPP